MIQGISEQSSAIQNSQIADSFTQCVRIELPGDEVPEPGGGVHAPAGAAQHDGPLGGAAEAVQLQPGAAALARLAGRTLLEQGECRHQLDRKY